MENPHKYDGSAIDVLEGLEHVRKRPAMYIGDTSKNGRHHLFKELIDNSIDEAMNGFCDEITVILSEDGETLSVEDNGRGIPVDKHPKMGVSSLEVVLTMLNAGGKFSDKGYKSAGGLHGVGASCVNALSDSMTAEVWREGGYYKQEYSRGVPKDKVKKISDLTKKDKQNGTRITFHPDPEIFKNDPTFDEHVIVTRIRQLAYLNKNLKILFINKQNNTQVEFKTEKGLSDYVSYLNESRENPYPLQPIYGETTIPLTTRSGDVVVEFACQWTQCDEDEEIMLSFANNIFNSNGGSHETGLKKAITRVVNDFARSLGLIKEKDSGLQGRDIQEGLATIVSVRFPQAEFVGQTKEKLATTEIEGIVSSAVGSCLTEYFEKNTAVIKKVIERAIIAAEARDAARKHASLIKRGGLFGKNNRMPSKLVDCNSERMEDCELFIVEGDSAGGSCKKGRNPEFQAYLPIRGKIINAEKNDLKKLASNKEVMAIIRAIGTGILDDFDISKLRYQKIIIMTDADTDGAHIATLLITFFYRYMKPLVMGGHLYIVQPPLYRVGEGKNRIYCFTQSDMQHELSSRNNKNTKVTRFKGLGEMDWDELGETTMEPLNRHLIKICLDDPGESERMLSVLMGSNVASRKLHIATQVNSVISTPVNASK